MTPFLTKRQAAMCLDVLETVIKRMREGGQESAMYMETVQMLTQAEWNDLTFRMGWGEVDGDDVEDYEVLEAVHREIRAIAEQDEARQGGDR